MDKTLKFRIARCLAVLLAAVALAETSCAGGDSLPGRDSPVPARYFGMHFHRVGAGTRLPSATIGSWRLWDAQVNWRHLARNGATIDFSPLDRLVSFARHKQVDLLYPFGVTPQWASARPTEKGPYGEGSAAEPADLAAWNDFVTRVVRRYKGRIREFEIWNEPNAQFYTGDKDALVKLTCAARAIIKAEDPEAVVVSPAVVGENRGNWSWLEEFLARGGRDCIDVVAYHFYVAEKPPEAMVGVVFDVQALMRARGVADKPLWNTESGWRLHTGRKNVQSIDLAWPKLDEETSAGYVSRALLLGWVLGLDRFYWYSWDHYDMGLVGEGGAETPSAGAYRTTRRWMLGGRFRGCELGGVQASCRIDGPGGPALVAWTTDGKSRTFVVPEGFDVLERLDGSTQKVAAGQAVSIGPQPIRLDRGLGSEASAQ